MGEDNEWDKKKKKKSKYLVGPMVYTTICIPGTRYLLIFTINTRSYLVGSPVNTSEREVYTRGRTYVPSHALYQHASSSGPLLLGCVLVYHTIVTINLYSCLVAPVQSEMMYIRVRVHIRIPKRHHKQF